MELIIDGFAHNIKVMTNKKLMGEWLTQVVEKADMQPYGKPYIQGFPWPGSKDRTALTAFQPLKESGLDVHCCPEISYIQISLFSCNDFHEGRVIAFIVGSLEMWRYKWLLLDRGIDLRTGKVILPSLRRSSDG